MLSIILISLLGQSLAYDNTFAFNSAKDVETRSMQDIYTAALAEGGIVTCWHGGDETNQQDALKAAFEEAFPGMTLNITVDLSKYHDGKLDEQLARGVVPIDSIILQTLHDFPRWAQEGVLLNYAPLGFDQIDPAYKDSTSAAWYGLTLWAWSFIWNVDKLQNQTSIAEFDDLLNPALKDKLVLTYPNDDDAILYAFDLIMQQHGVEWFDSLLEQNPRWVRGTGTPATLIEDSNSTSAVTFTSSVGFNPPQGIRIGFPSKAQFVSWPQTGAILKNSTHPEGAKLLHSFMLSKKYQEPRVWSVRQDIVPPPGFPYPKVTAVTSTNTADFGRWMGNRERVERLRFWFENRLGTAQGLSPLTDDLQ